MREICTSGSNGRGVVAKPPPPPPLQSWVSKTAGSTHREAGAWRPLEARMFSERLAITPREVGGLAASSSTRPLLQDGSPMGET
jgi:hypothetical protein